MSHTDRASSLLLRTVLSLFLAVSTARAQTEGGTITFDGGGFINSGEGTLTIAPGESVFVEGGVLNMDGGGTLNLGSGGINIGGGTITIPGTGTISGSGGGSLTIDGGTLVIGGGTTINSGTLTINGNLANVLSNTIAVNSGALLALSQSNTFGAPGEALLASITLHAGATIRNTANVFNTLGALTLHGGTLESTGVEVVSGLAFALKGTVTASGDSTSTITGDGIALGAADVSGTTFAVQDGAADVDLQVSATLRDGGGVSWPPGQASSLTKTGAGSMVLSGANAYTGTTSVTAGTLIVNGGGSIASTSVVTVGSGARLRVDGAVGAVAVYGILSGSGTVGAITLHRGATLAVGNSPGLMMTASATWQGGASLEFEINDATGIAGLNWDLLSVTGLLDLTSISASDKMNLMVVGADLLNFHVNSEYSWVFARAASLGGTESWLSGLDVTDRFVIQASGFNGGTLPAGGFRVVTGTEDGWSTLSLQSVPEPSTLSLLVLGAGVVAWRIRGKKRASRPIPRSHSACRRGSLTG